MSGTRDTLIESSTRLIRRRGYSAFSYADLAAEVGIRKPSIHHHFPTKEDLGQAIVAAYTERFCERLDAIAAAGGGRERQIQAYADIYREALRADQACLCGMLASEVSVLPERVRVGVTRFFDRNIRWLEQVLGLARDGKAKTADPKVHEQAVGILSALQGGLFVARLLGKRGVLEDAIAALARDLGRDAGSGTVRTRG